VVVLTVGGQPHSLFARFRQVCGEELPGMTERLVASGCLWGIFWARPRPVRADVSPRVTARRGVRPRATGDSRCTLVVATLREDGAIKSSVLGGVPARTDAPGTLYIVPMTTNQQILLWILLGIGGGMTYGRWRAERIRARHAMRATWEKRQDGRGGPTWKLW
jgi:hypothetical protein